MNPEILRDYRDEFAKCYKQLVSHARPEIPTPLVTLLADHAADITERFAADLAKDPDKSPLDAFTPAYQRFIQDLESLPEVARDYYREHC